MTAAQWRRTYEAAGGGLIKPFCVARSVTERMAWQSFDNNSMRRQATMGLEKQTCLSCAGSNVHSDGADQALEVADVTGPGTTCQPMTWPARMGARRKESQRRHVS